jgi:hypothetical protein
MKRKVGFTLIVVLAINMWLGMSVFSLSDCQARNVVAIEDSKFDMSLSMADNLKSYMGKNVFIHLKSGETFQGYVKAVGNGLVHLEKLTGKDFYDALIRIEEISAIETKFREMK